MNGDEFRKLQGLRVHLRGSGCFAFEKNGTYMLYREVRDGRNTKVLTSKNIDEFVRKATRATQRTGS